MNPDVILGGGVAGLAAAHFLSQKSQRPLILLERSPYLGGLASTQTWEGCRVDLGPHRIYTVLPGIERFILDLLGDEVIRVKRRSSMHLRGKFIEYPVSFKEVLNNLGPWCATRIGLSYGWSLATHRIGISRERQSYAEHISSRFGRYLYNLLFKDYAVKIWQDNPDRLSADMAKIRLATPNLMASAMEAIRPTGRGTVTEFLYPKGGIGRLSERMAQVVRSSGGKIECTSEVQRIILEKDRVKAIQGTSGGKPFEIQPDRVISTVPLPILIQSLEPSAPPMIQKAMQGLPFAN